MASFGSSSCSRSGVEQLHQRAPSRATVGLSAHESDATAPTDARSVKPSSPRAPSSPERRRHTGSSLSTSTGSAPSGAVSACASARPASSVTRSHTRSPTNGHEEVRRRRGGAS